MNVNKGRSWELNTKGERDGPVTCKRGKCRKSAQFRGAEVDEVNRQGGGGAGGDQKSSFAIKPVMDIPPPPPNIDPKGGVQGIK